MMRRDFVNLLASVSIGSSTLELGAGVAEAQTRVDHRRWQFVPGGLLMTDGVTVGEWLATALPNPGRTRAGRFYVVQLVTADCHLMIASQAIAPQRERVELTVPCIELAGSRWFPLNGNATLVTGGDEADELRVVLAEVV